MADDSTMIRSHGLRCVVRALSACVVLPPVDPENHPFASSRSEARCRAVLRAVPPRGPECEAPLCGALLLSLFALFISLARPNPSIPYARSPKTLRERFVSNNVLGSNSRLSARNASNFSRGNIAFASSLPITKSFAK